VALVSIAIVADLAVLIRPGGKIADIDRNIRSYLLRGMSALDPRYNLILAPAEHGRRHCARIFQPNATMAEGARVAAEQTFFRRIMHVDRMRIREKDLQLAERIGRAGLLAHVEWHLAVKLRPVDRGRRDPLAI